MAESSSVFAGSVPEFYDHHLGPVLFEPYAADLARRVADRAGDAVLETACGTGILTRQLRARLPPAVRLVATDLNQPMIDHARAMPGSTEQIEWQRADCAALPFPPASFSALVCQFGLMFVPEKPAAFREARRVLADGGLLAFNVRDSLAHNPYARVVQEAVAGFFPDDPPRFFDVPYGFHDVGAWRDLLTAHGFAEQAIEPVTLEARSTTAEQLAVGFVRGTPLSNAIQERGGAFDRIVEAAAAALARLGGEAPFRSTMRAIVITARAS
jgi:ubiquinone/menaquinone biosynthesis C-methylase UbiE